MLPSPPDSQPTGVSRREFLRTSAALFGSASLLPPVSAAAAPPEPIIDIHQHYKYLKRPDDNLLFHQATLGITTTVLLPGADDTGNPSSDMELNAAVLEFVRAHPKQFYFFANDRADRTGARQEMEKYLKLGAIGIGEQKTRMPCDSPHAVMVAELAQEYDVPVHIHFENGKYNTGIERFPKMLERFPRVKFIGHAQEWWGNIDKNHNPTTNYPTGKVTPGGLTDRMLSDYPNLWGDLAAGSGNNAFMRDEDHARWFIEKHQDKLIFGSDCTDRVAHGPICIGARQIATMRRLAPSKAVERKLLYENARKLLRIT